jgi:ribonuclease P protein component
MKSRRFCTLKKRSEFLKVAKAEQRFYGAYFLVQALPNNKLSDIFRVGYVATRKTGNAVKRNKAKRRLRSLVNKFKDQFVLQYDYVLIVRSSLWSAKFEMLQHDFCNVLKKIEKSNLLSAQSSIDTTDSNLSDND